MRFISIAWLALVLFLTGCASDKKPTNTRTPTVQKEVYVATTDVRPNIGFDTETKEWFWGATFSTFSVPKGTELKCKVTALASDKKTELASYEYPHIVANYGIVVPYGDFAILPSAEKSLVDSIKTFKIVCKKW
jgi:hypothetical protein